MDRIRINKVPFNYKRSANRISVIRAVGTYAVGTARGEVDPDMAAAAVALGHGEPVPSTATARRASSGRGGTRKAPPHASNNAGSSDRVGRTDLVAPDRTGDEPSDPDAG